MTTEPNGSIRKLKGRITGLSRSRQSRDFVLGQIGGGVGASAVAAGLSGMGGAAIAIAALDSTEKADFVEFSVDGETVRGWFWRFPFDDGDQIELVAERGEQGWVAYGVRREADGLVAVYPHCFEGRQAHYASTFRFWGVVVGAIFQLSAVGEYLLYGLPALVVVFGFLAWRAARKTDGFARIAETIFSSFGWSNVGRINLRKTSKALRRDGDGRDYGLRYFRY
jgi:hypothetical protein